MIKHTQTIRWQQPANCFGLFDHFVGLALKVLVGFSKLPELELLLLCNDFKGIVWVGF